MSYMGIDPGDLTPDEMWGRDEQADGFLPVKVMPCPGCHAHHDGTLDTEIMDEEGACVLGCGRKIRSREDGMCSHCGDHSANEWECPRCGTTYADWSGQWEKVR